MYCWSSLGNSLPPPGYTNNGENWRKVNGRDGDGDRNNHTWTHVASVSFGGSDKRNNNRERAAERRSRSPVDEQEDEDLEFFAQDLRQPETERP